MTTEAMTQNKVLLEDLRKEMRLLGEAHAGHTEHLARTEAELKQRFKDIEHQIIVLDVKVHKKIDALGKKTDALDKTVDALGKKTDALDKTVDALGKKTDALDKTVDALGKKVDVLDTKLDVMSTAISRMATHFGLNGKVPPRGRLLRAAKQRRKAR